MTGAPEPSSPEASYRMRRTPQRDTQPELALRRLLHRSGLRYRVDMAPEPGIRRRADIVFSGQRVAVFVDGCFWHGCPLHGGQPRANGEWWEEKIRQNRVRDVDTADRLSRAGWVVLRAWEHEDPWEVAAKVVEVVSERRARDRPPRVVKAGAAQVASEPRR